MIYCDSSFLLALSIRGEVFTPIAAKIASDFTEAIPLIGIAEVEWKTRIHRGLGDGSLTINQHALLLRQIEDDVADGILVRKSLIPAEYLDCALKLSKNHAVKIPIRSLDILHVAAAKLLRCKKFASFDKRQRELAAAEKFQLLPARLP
jgi:predicted nucleic acid-binding protein